MTISDTSTDRDPGLRKSGEVEFGFDTADGYFALTMKESGAPGLVKGDKEKGFHLVIIPGDKWKVAFTLDPRQKWDFDDPAISFKNPEHAKYYRTDSHGPHKVVMTMDSTQAAYSPPPWTEQNHPFNLHLEVKQSANKSYKLTIDPDIRNPPLNGGG